MKMHMTNKTNTVNDDTSASTNQIAEATPAPDGFETMLRRITGTAPINIHRFGPVLKQQLREAAEKKISSQIVWRAYREFVNEINEIKEIV